MRLALSALVLCACVGEMQGASTAVGPLCAQTPRLSRLSGRHYRAIVTALVPDAGFTTLAVPFAQPRRTDLFTSWSGQASIGEYEVDEVWGASETVATAWSAANPAACLGSTRTAECLRRVYVPALSLLWSREPTAPELEDLEAQLTEAEQALEPAQASVAVLRRVLMGQQFLFRHELGVGGSLSSAEVAAALSFTLRDEPPDATLRALTKSDSLTDPTVISAQAQRLLERPTEVPMLRRFLKELFEYEQTTRVFKSAADYPFHRPGELVDDTERVVEQLVSEHARSGLLRALLTSDLVYVRPTTAASWALPQSPDAGTFAHDPTRSGVLTHPAWLSAMSQSDHNHLVRRGRFVRERLLCGEVPMLPGGVVPEIAKTPGLTLRQRNEQHSKDPACSGCHALMDPLAMGFEAWDHVGRPQTMDNGSPVQTDGTLSGAGDSDGPYRDAPELLGRLAASPTVRACWVKNLFRSVRGREVSAADACELERLTALYESSGEDTLAVIEAMFTSPEFLQRKQVGP